MVVVGDQNHALVGMALHPFGTLLGVADRVQSRMIDVDTAREQGFVPAGDRPKLFEARSRMHPADQQSLTLAGFQQMERGIETRLPARQHDDSVGRGGIFRGGETADMAGKPDEAAGENPDCTEDRENGNARRQMGGSGAMGLSAPNRSSDCPESVPAAQVPSCAIITSEFAVMHRDDGVLVLDKLLETFATNNYEH